MKKLFVLPLFLVWVACLSTYWKETQMWAQSFSGLYFSGGPTSPALEPGTLLFLGSGLLGTGFVIRNNWMKKD